MSMKAMQLAVCQNAIGEKSSHHALTLGRVFES
jgi:hypothetical protein